MICFCSRAAADPAPAQRANAHDDGHDRDADLELQSSKGFDGAHFRWAHGGAAAFWIQAQHWCEWGKGVGWWCQLITEFWTGPVPAWTWNSSYFHRSVHWCHVYQARDPHSAHIQWVTTKFVISYMIWILISYVLTWYHVLVWYHLFVYILLWYLLLTSGLPEQW